jgi:hypothetical protein
VFDDNDAPDGIGGGIAASGLDPPMLEVTITDTAITGGDAAAGGGLAFAGNMDVQGLDRSDAAGGVTPAQAEASAEVIGSTFADNTATVGGAVVSGDEIIVVDGVVTIDPGGAFEATNSTFTGIAASESGGALTVPGGEVALVYVTASSNTAPSAAQVQTASLSVFGTVLGPSSGPSCDVESTTSHGYNRGTDATCGLTAPTDQQDVGDPQLGPLADNGGPTPTLLPLTGSLLIDAIPSAACQDDGAAGVTTDQRGVARPQIGGCDVGAVEVEPVFIVLQPTFTG